MVAHLYHPFGECLANSCFDVIIYVRSYIIEVRSFVPFQNHRYVFVEEVSPLRRNWTMLHIYSRTFDMRQTNKICLIQAC